MRTLLLVTVAGLTIAGLSYAQNASVIVETNKDTHYLPPAPPQAQPLTDQYLSQLRGKTDPPPANISSVPPPAYTNAGQPPIKRSPVAPYAPNYGGPQSRPGSMMNQPNWGYSQNLEPKSWLAPGFTNNRGVPRAGNNPIELPPAPRETDLDPGEHLPPELAKRRTALKRATRQENHELLGELMTAQDAVEDIMSMERPDPEAVGKAYAQIFDIQRRMIELRVRTKNALLTIWDEARVELKGQSTASLEGELPEQSR